MAGPTTAERGAAKPARSGPPRSRPALRRPRRRTLIAALVGVVLLGVGGVWVLYGSTWLRVERVTVHGAEVLTPREVVAEADVPLGAPLVSVDTDAVAARLRAGLPRIATVDVVRSWPHGIDLNVSERHPELLIEERGKFVEVDVEGVRFATVGRAPHGVPLLELDSGESPSLRRFGTQRLQREAVGVAAGLPEPIHRETRVVRVSSYDSITLELTDGRTVMWGSGEQSAAKARALAALLKTAPDARHFDVSAPTAPAGSRS